MRASDFLVHTSLREATSSVIPEALSVGLPVLCHDANGMGIAVTKTCGIKVPLVSFERSIRGFHDAMVALVSDTDYLASLKAGASMRSIELSWDNMAQRIAYDYRMAIERNVRELPIESDYEDTSD
jgi:glycosyltransferase involved in cell wall biosynthesis